VGDGTVGVDGVCDGGVGVGGVSVGGDGVCGLGEGGSFGLGRCGVSCCDVVLSRRALDLAMTSSRDILT
jgi:hypothetical protein